MPLLKSTLKTAKTTSCQVNIIGISMVFRIQCEKNHITILKEKKKKKKRGGWKLLVCVSSSNERTDIVHPSSTLMPECPPHLLAY